MNIENDNNLENLKSDKKIENGKLKKRIFKGKNNKRKILGIMLVSLTIISVGFAYVKTTLSAGGNVKFDASINKFEITILGQKMTASIDNKKSEFVTSSTGINFGVAPSDINGKGLYLLSSTANDTYPIYYFRGGDDSNNDGIEDYLNNNVLFGGFCWKIVRTTEKGGTKLIYNGTQFDSYNSYTQMSQSEYKNVTNDATYPFTFNSTTKKWTSSVPETSSYNSNNKASIKFSVPSNGCYVLDYTVSSYSHNKIYIYVNGNEIANAGGEKTEQISLPNLKTSDIIEVQYQRYYNNSNGSNNIVFSLNKGVGASIKSCANTGTASQLSTTSAFNKDYKALSDVGYMYGTRYTYTSWKDTAYIYGSDVTYANGVYTLVNPTTSADTIANIKTKHYTCKLTTNGTCGTVYYVYHYYSTKDTYAIELRNGKKLENIVTESFANTNNSVVKTSIENWFRDNLASQVSKLEDAVWCNDRSITSGGYLHDGDATKETIFGGYQRNLLTTQPKVKNSEACSNKSDRFTVSDTTVGNGALTYMVGLITVDEATLAGNGYNGYSKTSYLYTGQYYWTMSPYWTARFGYSTLAFNILPGGQAAGDSTERAKALRPSIVLKAGTVATSGSGTLVDPYVVN